MDSGALLIALTAGMLAAFNPCGFALLPAYLALFLGDRVGQSSGSAVARALGVGAAVTAGFVTVFGLAGIAISGFALQVSAWTPYLTIVVGPLLVVLGIWFLSGREFSLRLPRLSNNAGTGLAGMYVYGIVYATVSLSCTIPVFLVAVVGAFRSESWLSGVIVLLAYAAGMGLVLTALAIALALAKDGFVRNSRRVLPYLNRFAGVLLMVAGVYVTWYGYVEIRVLAGDAVSRGPVDAVARWSGSVTTAIDNNSTLVALALAGVVVAALIGLSFRRRRNPTTSVTAGEPTAVPSGKDSP